MKIALPKFRQVMCELEDLYGIAADAQAADLSEDEGRHYAVQLRLGLKRVSKALAEGNTASEQRA